VIMRKLNTMETFGKRLRSLRKAKGVTLEEASKAVGMSHNTLSELERDFYPSSSFMVRLAAYYGVSPDWLETGRGGMTTEPLDNVTTEIMSIYGKLDDRMKAVLLEQARALSKIKK
jgi:HTH-type transcriptional regulator, cell division transcriptional repressor